MKKAITFTAIILCLTFLAGCSPTPDRAQVEAAIRQSLSAENSPELDFSSLEVPISSAGKAEAIIWTTDETEKHYYTVTFDRQSRVFTVAAHTVERNDAEQVYYSAPNDTGETKTGVCFDFSGHDGSNYMLIYCGEGKDLSALRTGFEAENLSDFGEEITSQFEVCDLGGDTLVLLVPRYVGMNIDVYKVGSIGDALIRGDLVAGYGHMPVYIYCDFTDVVPGHEIHVAQGAYEHMFTTNEALLELIK